VPSVVETTALGTAFGAGIATGVWTDTSEVSRHWQEAVRYRSSMDDAERSRLLAGWSKAVDRSLGWIE